MPPVAPPSPLNLYVGAGMVYAERFDANGVGLGLNPMGNVDTFSVNTTVQQIVKRQSMTRTKGIYAIIPQHADPILKIVASEFTVQNCALALLATPSVLVQPATAVVGEAVMPATIPGGYFRTKKLGPISAVTVKFGGVSGVLNTDYVIVDAKAGLIQILLATVLTGAVTIDYTPTAYTSTTGPGQMAWGAAPLINCRFVFIGDPQYGSARYIEIWKAQCQPDAAHDLIADGEGNISLTATLLDDSVNHPTAPYALDTFVPA